MYNVNIPYYNLIMSLLFSKVESQAEFLFIYNKNT